jgi:hypothetical protein
VDAPAFKQHRPADFDSPYVHVPHTPPKQRQGTEANVEVVTLVLDAEVMERSPPAAGTG